jgi:hypothetical protein
LDNLIVLIALDPSYIGLLGKGSKTIVSSFQSWSIPSSDKIAYLTSYYLITLALFATIFLADFYLNL